MVTDADMQNAVRAVFGQYFTTLTSDVFEAAELQRILDGLASAHRSLLINFAEKWNQRHDLLRRIPSEVIALCFECLPFRDRVTATHVARGWRSIALAHPAIWADVDLRGRFGDKLGLLKLALARAGQLPAVIRDCPDSLPPCTIWNILQPHFSHIQYLELPYRVSPAQLIDPAPHLRYLLVQTNCTIEEGFLGGREGQLRTLILRSVVFPSICPALSTVTHLTLNSPLDPDDAATYRPLFRFFPALQSLSLLEVEFFETAFTPNGPAPLSLRRLVLQTSPSLFDVCEYYGNWASIALNISEVTITQYLPPTRHLCHLLSGAVELVIGSEEAYPQIVSVGPGERRRVLNLWGRSGLGDSASETLLDLRSYLSDVRTFQITSAPRAGLLAILHALPNLADLTVTLDYENLQSSLRGEALSLLSRVPDHCPSLQSVTIRVERHGRPACDVASALLAELEALGHIGLPDVLVQGFTREDIRGLQLPRFDGFRVIFAPEAGST